MFRLGTPRASVASLALLSLLAAACADQAPTPPAHAASADHMSHAGPAVRFDALGPDVQSQIAQLRALTASFHDFETAKHAGWDAPVPGCFFNPGVGGMGFHFLNQHLLDGRVDPLQPQILLFEPQKNGQMKFVAVEYAVPFTVRPATAEPPVLYGIPFHRNDAFGLWILHVWQFDDNPLGIFNDWNPRVSCEFAPA